MRDEEVFDYQSIPAGFYDAVHSQGDGIQAFWHRKKFETVARTVLERTPSRGLDVGCGPGTFIGNYMLEVPYVGVDLARPQIEYARERYANESHSFLTALDFTSIGDVDVVTAIEFLEHITYSDAEDLLVSLRSLLGSRGALVLTTPNYGGLWPALEWLIDRFAKGPKYDQQHISKYRRRNLRALLERCGYEIVVLKGLMGLAPFLSALNWSLAERWAKLESWLVERTGFLLLVVAIPDFQAQADQ